MDDIDFEFVSFFGPGFITNLPSVFLRLGFPLSGSSLLRLLGKQNALNVGENTALGDGNSGEQLVQLLVVPVSATHLENFN